MSNQTPLLEAAQSVLGEAGFSARVEPLEQSGASWLLAEDELFAVGVIAGDTLDELKSVESVAAKALLGRFSGSGEGPKKWDLYLVLLTTQPWNAIDSRERVGLLYNMKGLRRLIGAQIPNGGEELRNSVSRVLRPFLPLTDSLESGLAGLEEDLVRALIVNGVDSESAPRFVAAYQAEGSLEGV